MWSPTVETVGYGITVNILDSMYTKANGFNRWGCTVNLDNGKKAISLLLAPIVVKILFCLVFSDETKKIATNSGNHVY